MQNINWSRGMVAEELEDTIKFGGLTDCWSKIRIKETDAKGKTYYVLKFDHGSIKVYGPRFILVNRQICRSAYEAKQYIQMEYVR
jgi:hypothetical protein